MLPSPPPVDARVEPHPQASSPASLFTLPAPSTTAPATAPKGAPMPPAPSPAAAVASVPAVHANSVAALPQVVAEPVSPQPAPPPVISASPSVHLPSGPPALPPLPKLPDDTASRVANSQVNIYLYQQLAAEAAALKALCETNYGPSDLCQTQRPMPPAAAPVVEMQGEGPGISLVQVLGDDRHLSAVLQLAGGRELTVHEGSPVPGKGRVIRITADEVRLALANGGEGTVGFSGESISGPTAPKAVTPASKAVGP